MTLNFLVTNIIKLLTNNNGTIRDWFDIAIYNIEFSLHPR